ncbi:MAG: hypothetical protein ABJB12_05730 [Pseudomonadota bacterium]
MKLAPACALLGCLFLASVARAEPAATLIVLVADDPSDAVAGRLARDLRGLGFGVVLLGATPENSTDRAALERTARSLGGLATVRVLPGDQGSQLWVLEPGTGRSVTRELTLPPGSTPDANEVALGTLELLRASMLELHPPLAPPAHPEPVVEPAPLARPSEPAEHALPVFSLTAGAGAELGLRSVGPSFSMLWAAWLRLRAPFGLRAFAAIPGSSEHGQVAEGSVEVRASLLGVGLALAPEHNGAWLMPRASCGAALAAIETRGIALDPRTSHGASAWLGGGYAQLGAGLRLARDVRLDLDLTGVVLPTPALIMVGGREVGRWGAPGGIVSLGVEVFTND